MGVDAGMSLIRPPRAVPWALRVQLLTNRGVVLGGLLFGICSAPAVVLILASDPIGAWRLAGEVSTAPGRLVAVEDLHYRENGSQVFRCRYTFRTPDGTGRRGVCYMKGPAIARPRPAVERNPELPQPILVKYSPQHPETSCIQSVGMRPGATDPMFGLFSAVGALVGMVIVLLRALAGWRKVRLLAVGELARASLVSCRFASRGSSDTPGGELSIAQVRQSWLAPAGPGKVPVGDPLLNDQIPSLVRTLGVWFLRLWTCGAIVLFGLGVVFLIFALCLEPLKRSGLIRGKPQPAGPGLTLFFWGLLATWLIVGPMLIRSGLRGLALVSGKKSFAQLNPNPTLRCTFEFTLPGGQTILAQDMATFSARLGDAPTEPVLYDPARPDRALLVEGLSPTVEISEFGDWHATQGLRTWLRLALVVALILGGPTVGWMAWHGL